MTRTQILASALLIMHLAAITVAVVRDPRDTLSTDAEETAVGPLAAELAPGMNAVAQKMEVANDAIWRGSGWLRRMTTPYVGVLGLYQQWNMFASPPRSEEYLRVSFAIAPSRGTPTGRQRVVQWLVYPTWRPDRVRGLQAFSDSYRDKALELVINNFIERKGPQLLNTLNQRRRSVGPTGVLDLERKVAAAGRDFEPVVRYYFRQYRRKPLEATASIERTEVWYGEAPISPPEETAALDRETRNKALASEFDGPITTSRMEQPSLGKLERQAGVVWTLCYVGAP